MSRVIEPDQSTLGRFRLAPARLPVGARLQHPIVGLAQSRLVSIVKLFPRATPPLCASKAKKTEKSHRRRKKESKEPQAKEGKSGKAERFENTST